SRAAPRARPYPAHAADFWNGPDIFKTITFIERGAQAADFFNQVLALHGAVDRQDQRFIVDRLGDVIVSAKSHRLDSRFDAPKSGDHNDGGLHLFLRQPSQKFDTVEVRHTQIGEAELRTKFEQHAMRIGPGGRKLDSVAGL